MISVYEIQRYGWINIASTSQKSLRLHVLDQSLFCYWQKRSLFLA